MDQAVAAFFVLGLLGLLLGGAIVVLVAYSRERSLTRRIEWLEKTVHALSAASRESRAAPQPQPTIATPTPSPAAPKAPERVPSPIESSPVSRPVAPPPPPPRAPLAPPSQKPRVSIERALGVTGAAVLGGVVFAIAGIYLYQYSVQQGLLTPAVRVALGTGVGVACLAASELLRKRGYRITADSLAGGAVVVLFAAFWAANRVFHLWPFGLSFALMAAVTALCCALALRHSSQVIAVLGLVGGFATPIALSTGSDRPIGLFGWTLLVNLGFLSVAHKRRWPWMGIVALGGTFVIEALWIFARMGPHTFVLAIAVLAVFALLFVGFVAMQPPAERARWQLSAIGAVLLPFAFALYFSSSSDVLAGGHFYPTALLAALLCAAATWLARTQGLTFMPFGTAAGSVALALLWIQWSELTSPLAWEFAACCALIACVLHAGRALPDKGVSDAAASSKLRISERDAAALLATSGFAIALIVGAAQNVSIELWPWASGLFALAVLTCWQSVSTRQPAVSIVSSLLSGIGLYTWVVADRRPPDAVPELALIGVLLAFVVLHQGVAMRFSDDRARKTAWWAAGFSALLAQATAGSAVGAYAQDLHLLLAVILVFGVLSAMAASGGRTSALLTIGALTTSGAVWTFVVRGTLLRSSSLPLTFLLVALGAILFTLWPLVRTASWASSRAVWRVAAASTLLWFQPLRHVWRVWLTERAIGFVPLVLAVVSGVAWRLASRAGVTAERNVARAWLAAFALFWLSLALPLQIDRDWVLVGFALAGASQIWLWTKYDHAPLKYVGSTLLAIATGFLVLKRFSGSYAIHEAKLVNWLAWSYLVPAAAAMLASIWLGKLEIARLRAAERSHYKENVALCASLCGLCAAALCFAWLNLAILNAFGTIPKFQWLSIRFPARDLTMSIAWALYALALLVLGVNRRIGSLRWVSLAMVMLTIAKVFLFDLGNLQGLYRVASLLGLAVALLLVSLLYQRFVFRVSSKDGPRAPSPNGSDAASAEPERAR